MLCVSSLGAALVAAPASAIRTNEQYGFMNQIGGPGAGVGQFGGGSNPGPYGVAVDAAGNVFVVDPHNSGDRVHKFSPDGTHICSFGPYGTTVGQLGSPFGIAVAPNGTVYVVDTWRSNANRVQYYTSPDGGNTYSNSGQLAIAPAAGEAFNIAADGAGHIYVTDNAGKRVLKYNVASGTLVATIGTTGSEQDLLTFPKGLAVTPDGLDLYVADNAYVKRFHSAAGLSYAVDQLYGEPASVFPLGGPWGVAVDVSGNLYAADGPDRIVKYTSSGVLVWSWGTTGPGDYQFRGTRAVAVSSTGCVYVADTGFNDTPEHALQNHRVMRYARDLTPPVSVVSGLPSGWTNAATVNLTFSGTDPAVADRFTSGYGSTELFLNGGWTTYAGAFQVAAEGTTTIQYRALDNRANVEADQQLQVRIDRTKPSITSPHTGIPTGWSKTPVTVSFGATDALSLVARTEYSTDGGATWTAAGSATIGNGTTTLLYRAVDNAGNVGDTVSDVIKVDGVKPKPKPLADVTVKRKESAKLRYRITDSACPQVAVYIKIRKAGKTRKTIQLGTKSTGRDLSYSFKCTLPKSTYTWTVYATDLAGNKQARTFNKKLIVK